MNKNKLKLLDIDALELARQLTLLESALYKKIRAIECLQRAREQRAVGEHRDHITDVIQMTNKVSPNCVQRPNLIAETSPIIPSLDCKLGERYDPQQRGFAKASCNCQTIYLYR